MKSSGMIAMPPPTTPVYQPVFLEARLPHDLNFVVMCRPPMFVRLIPKSYKWHGRPAVEHYYYWSDARGVWQEHVVGITGVVEVYADRDQPSIGWERYFQHLRNHGYSIPTQPPPATAPFGPWVVDRTRPGIPNEKDPGDGIPRGIDGRPLAPTLEELWLQGITPSASPGGTLCQFSLLNSGVAIGAAPTEVLATTPLTFLTAGDALRWEATPRQAPEVTPRQAVAPYQVFGDFAGH
ncbi:hypothetical protein FRC05_004702 [Tulasnella sp. 425]|nr:hypothetical protein FRC05_004702 [Tulasnella sp. 425]